MKKIISLMLVFALILSSLCAFAASDIATVDVDTKAIYKIAAEKADPSFTYAALKTRALTTSEAIPEGVPFVPEFEYADNGDGTVSMELVGGRIVSEAEMYALMISDAEIAGVISCPKCHCTSVNYGHTTTVTQEVGSSDCCYKTMQVRPISCAACGYAMGNDVLSTTSHGHTFVLLPSGVFYECSRCGCMKKA